MQVRLGLTGLVRRDGPTALDRGQIRESSRIERFKSVAIPVRRALNATDRVSAAAALETMQGIGAPLGLNAAGDAWTALQRELDQTIAFGGGRVPQRAILAAFLDAAAFYDPLDRETSSDAFIDTWGTAGEALGCQLAEDAAKVIVQLDSVAAAVLDEPEILPPPEKTPPPPPDPQEPLWKRIMSLIRPGE